MLPINAQTTAVLLRFPKSQFVEIVRWLNPLPVKHATTIQDGGIENLVYRALRSKITPVRKICQDTYLATFY